MRGKFNLMFGVRSIQDVDTLENPESVNGILSVLCEGFRSFETSSWSRKETLCPGS